VRDLEVGFRRRIFHHAAEDLPQLVDLVGRVDRRDLRAVAGLSDHHVLAHLVERLALLLGEVDWRSSFITGGRSRQSTFLNRTAGCMAS
jgi:hypothetical protein